MDDSEIMVEKDVNEVVKHYFHRQGTSTRFSARATATGLTGKTCFWFVLFFSPFRSGGVVRNYICYIYIIYICCAKTDEEPDDWICPSCEQ